jgi:hypothetical protein
MTRSSGRASKSINFLVALAGLILSLLLVEVAFRILQPAKASKRWSDRPYGYFLPSNSTTLQGAAVGPKQPGTFRISVVGDSFTFAPHMQYQDTFAKKLETFLNLNEGAQKVEVLNMGVSGASTATEFVLVRKALERSSDLVILEITLNDAEPRLLSPAEKAKLYDAPYLSSPILKVWRSLGFVLTRLHNTATVSRYIDYHIRYFKDPETFKRFDDALSSMKAATQAKGVPLVAVVFPLFDFPIDAQYPFSESHEIINRALEAHEIKALDLRGAYKGIPPERLQVIPTVDNHPNEIAHRIAAERLLAFLRTSKVIPTELLPKRIFRARTNLREKRANPERIFERADRSG